MSARNMAGLMGDHTGKLFGSFGANDKAGVQKQVLPARHKRVQAIVTDQKDPHRFTLKPGRIKYWSGDRRDRRFNFRIANDCRGLGLGRHDQGQNQTANKGAKAPAQLPLISAQSGSTNRFSPVWVAVRVQPQRLRARARARQQVHFPAQRQRP